MSKPIPRVQRSTNLPSSFPAELSDAIIDYLHDDIHSLGTCALVCKRWLPSSRYHLFGRVTVSPKNVGKLVELLQSPLSTIPQVSHMRMYLIQSAKQFDDTLSSLSSLTPLRSVHSLSLNQVILESTTKAIISQPAFGAVAELKLEEVRFGEFHHFVDFMSGFSLLETFVVKHLSWRMDTHLSAVWWTTPSTLRVLDLDLCPVVGILKWLRLCPPIPPIHTVRFRGLTTPWLSGIQCFLREIGPSLQHLSLTYHSSHNERMTGNELCRHLDLSHNCALRSIDLDMTLHQLFLPLSPLVKGTPLLLSRITSLVTEEVIFRLLLHSFEDINSLDWHHLERVFALPQFLRLRRIHCELGYTADEDVAKGWRNTITANLPACHARGILQIAVVSLPDTTPQSSQK